MIRFNDLETLLRIYHVERVSENKWKLGEFHIVFSNDMVTIYGKFFYSLAKEICSTPYYLSELFLSKEKEILSFEHFLTNYFIEQSVSSFFSDCALYSSYEDYCMHYNLFRLHFVKDCINSGRAEEVFLNEIVLTTISALCSTLKIIENFA